MELESANCKCRVSQCGDLELLTVDRPLKVHMEINGLETLVQELRAVFARDHVNVQDVQKLMLAYESKPRDWKRYAKFDRFRYTRNLVDEGNGAFNIMILCWGPGHASAIHDHADSHCFMKVLGGTLEEVRYQWPNNVEPEVLRKMNRKGSCCSADDDSIHDQTVETNGNCMNSSAAGPGPCEGPDQHEDGDGYDENEMDELGRTSLEVNDVCYINDAMGLHRMENPSHVDGAVSLHLYCPPFDSCRMFDARTGKPTEIKVTFWSMYGKKIKRVIEASDVIASVQ